MIYTVTITTLDGQIFEESVESDCGSNNLCESIFNQTPNVRSVEVYPKD